MARRMTYEHFADAMDDMLVNVHLWGFERYRLPISMSAPEPIGEYIFGVVWEEWNDHKSLHDTVELLKSRPYPEGWKYKDEQWYHNGKLVEFNVEDRYVRNPRR